ncbi:hypothetical protein [Variovorax sp. E3]|uniref:hypothetical protein n=1 Tax=Variovorax sp. E3 TaxID=1914993 RepID=UPI0027DB50C5|nr:hypothetical protein [Variovorax sp. E3]
MNREIRPLARVPHIVGYQCAGTVVGVGPGVHERRSGTAWSPCSTGARMRSWQRPPWPTPGRSPRAWTSTPPRPCPWHGARRTNACSPPAGSRQGTACWCTPARARWAWPPSSSRSKRARGSSPRRPAPGGWRN